MRSYWHLTKAQLKLFARNRQVLFFSLLFPILLMLALGSFLGNGNQVNLSGMLVDEDQTEMSAAAMQPLLAADAIGLEQVEKRETALDALNRGDIQLVVIIPAGYGQAIQTVEAGADAGTTSSPAPTPAKLEVYYDETNMAISQLGVQYVGGVVDAISKGVTGYAPAVELNAQAVKSLGLKYIDFLVPGIVAMMIMSSNLNGVAGQIASWRERGVLRRMQSTTLKASTFIAAQITARLLLNGSQAVIVLLIASLVFGTNVTGSWALLLFYVVLGTLVFMAIGFIIAGLAKTPESAGPIAGLISFPLLFLGNVFFPVRNMPEFLQPFVKALPITHLSETIREVMNVGAGVTALWGETLILGGWMVAAFIVASLTFKWE
jgi:ABC-2 type transport system permease protein